MDNLIELSKEISYALRHASWEYELEMDEEGLLPNNRQYVHLSQDIETAHSVGIRHDSKPYILKIDAKQVWKDGIKFYYGNEKVWLADKIPSRYIMKTVVGITTSYRCKYK